MTSHTSLPLRVTLVLTSLALAGTALVGCAPDDAPAASAEPTPTASVLFDSVFTYDGSQSLSTDVADQLEVRLELWADDPKRTQEWTTENPKGFGFAVNVYDHRVDEKAVLEQKRRVYISAISITSQTSQTSGQVSQPFQFTADPRTLVPTDTLRSDQGLLLNSYQGGLLVPTTTIAQLPSDTYGLTLQFAMTVTVEGAAAGGAFTQQTVYQTVPIAIVPAVAGTPSPTP
jgi:hypothetical protein